MNIAIIADDLTGANDTGVQLARKGLASSVLLDYKEIAGTESNVIVIDTDSRSISMKDAYERVQEACTHILRQERFEWIYKKIDSTLRGNIGCEIDAVYDCARPDFVVVAPSFPSAGRVVRDGCLYVHGVPLHLTHIAKDPKNPVRSSSLQEIIQGQSKRKTAAINLDQLHGDFEGLMKIFKECMEHQIPYLIFDVETDQDLHRIQEVMSKTEYRIVWAGSAGLANVLSEHWIKDTAHVEHISVVKGPVLIVVGSVHPMSRRQLDHVLHQPDVIGIELGSEKILEPQSREVELARMKAVAEAAFAHTPAAVVLYSAGGSEDVKRAKQKGLALKMNDSEISNEISRVLGELAASMINSYGVRKLIMTGGDTARQVCLSLGAAQIELMNEVSIGISLGRLSGNEERYMITKAGGFGDEDSLNKALQFFREEQTK